MTLAKLTHLITNWWLWRNVPWPYHCQIAWDGCSHNLFSESPVVHCSLFPSRLGPPSSTLISAISLPVASVLCFYGLKRIGASLMGDQDTEGSPQSVYRHLQTRLLSGQLVSLGKIWCQVFSGDRTQDLSHTCPATCSVGHQISLYNHGVLPTQIGTRTHNSEETQSILKDHTTSYQLPVSYITYPWVLICYDRKWFSDNTKTALIEGCQCTD